MGIQETLIHMHQYLMGKKIPYHSVSVIHRHQDLGFHCIFEKSAKELITSEIQEQLKKNGFTYSINQ